jgi:hypothetical protein
METNLEKRTQSGSQVASAATPRSMGQGALGVAGSPAWSLARGREHSGLRFPPTRAARASRGRGVFLEEADEVMGAGRARWIEAPLAIVALAIAAFALAVCVNAPSIVTGAIFGTNPGPAIVAAASVAPPFVLPANSR